jgi:hypothetical protein
MENKVIRVVGQNHSTFVSKLADMNRRLSKKNLPLINAELIEEYDIDTVESTPVPYEPFAIDVPVRYHYFTYELSSEFDQKNIAGVDVQFEGVVDLIDKNENAKVFKLADSNLFKYLDNCQCDECHKSIGRNKYIVFSKSGKPVESRNDLVVLGTSCAKNYFPFDVVSYIGNVENFYEELFEDCDDSMGFGFHSDNYINTRRLFSLVGCVTDDFKVYTKDGGTKGDVELLIKGKKSKDFVYVEPKTKWEDMEQWLKAAYGEAKDEFSTNVHGVMFDPYSEELKLRDDIDMKYLGIACYAFVGAKKAHDKELEKQARAKMYKDSVKDEWFGNVGDKFEKELMFEKIIGFEGYYGYTYFLFFRDEEGRVFKWSSSNGSYKCWSSISGNDGYCDYGVGKKYFIKGSIKDHSEYNGVKQTVITRCKVLKDEYKSHVFSEKEIRKILESKKSEEPAETGSYEDPLEVFEIA